MLVLKQILSSTKVWFFIFAAIIALFALSLFDHLLGFDEKGVLVEAHGMFFDLLMFGIVLTAYEVITERNREIKRYKEELSDYKGWNADGASYRNAGNIRRLSNLGASDLRLDGLYLRGSNLEGIDLSGSKMNLCNLKMVNLRGANLSETVLDHVDLSESMLGEVNLEGAKLFSCRLEQSYLKGIKLQGSRGLKTASLKGAVAFEDQREEFMAAGATEEQLSEMLWVKRNSRITE